MEQDSIDSNSGAGLDENTRKRVVTFGSKFFVMNELFIERRSFMVARPENISSQMPARYGSLKLRRAAVVAELYEEVSKDCHILLEQNVAFRQTVCFQIIN